MAFSSGLQIRKISTTLALFGKRNFRKFVLFSRGSEEEKKTQAKDPFREKALGVRIPAYLNEDNELVQIPEHIPELIVPDLTDFKLKPYVSYRAADVIQSEFTAKDLFNACYTEKIAKDFKNGDLDEEGNPLNPSEDERRTVEEAWVMARKTGSDIFCPDPPLKQPDEPFM